MSDYSNVPEIIAEVCMRLGLAPEPSQSVGELVEEAFRDCVRELIASRAGWIVSPDLLVSDVIHADDRRDCLVRALNLLVEDDDVRRRAWDAILAHDGRPQ